MGFRLAPVSPIMPISNKYPKNNNNGNNGRKQEQVPFDKVLRDEMERQTQAPSNIQLPEGYQPFVAYANVFHRLVDYPSFDEKG